MEVLEGVAVSYERGTPVTRFRGLGVALFRVLSCGCRVLGFGFRGSGVGFRVWGFGSQVSCFGCRVSGFGYVLVEDEGR